MFFWFKELLQVIVQIVRHPNTYYRYTILHSKGLYLHINCNKMFEYEPLLNRRWIETSFRVQRSLTNVFLYIWTDVCQWFPSTVCWLWSKFISVRSLQNPSPGQKAIKHRVPSGSFIVSQCLQIRIEKEVKSTFWIYFQIDDSQYQIWEKIRYSLGHFDNFVYLIVERREKGKNFPISFRACLTVSYF